jgi:hypothetical protein
MCREFAGYDMQPVRRWAHRQLFLGSFWVQVSFSFMMSCWRVISNLVKFPRCTPQNMCESWDVSPFFRNMGIWWRWSPSGPAALSEGKNPGDRWLGCWLDPRTVPDIWRRKNPLHRSEIEIRLFSRPVRSLVTISTELSPRS